MIELEKKWLLKSIPDFVTEGYEMLHVQGFVQTYLGKSERLRQIENLVSRGEDIKYEHHIKEKIGIGQSKETCRKIDKEEYDQLYSQKVRELTKVRMTFREPLTGLVYETDEIHLNNGIVILMMEVEFQDQYESIAEVDEHYKLPDFIQKLTLADVTGQDGCSNWALSEHIPTQNTEQVLSEEDIAELIKLHKDG